MSDLCHESCQPIDKSQAPMAQEEAVTLLCELNGWDANCEMTEISYTWQFKNYYETMAFVNVVAWVAHQQDHHPDMEVSYNRCRVVFSTHSVGGLSRNDFICAARIDALEDAE